MKREPSSPSSWIDCEHLHDGHVGAAVEGARKAPQMPAESEVKRLAELDPTMRTVEVEQFCSWSACSNSSRFKARATSGAVT